MNTARLESARYRGGNGAISSLRRKTGVPATPLRRLGRACLSVFRRRCLANDPRDQLWTWFLPNPAVGEPREPALSGAGGTSESTRTANIVLVEPDRQMRERLRLWLQLDGHRVAECADESEALKIIAQEPPDVIVLDLTRSVASWMGFIVGLNRLRPRPNVRVIAIAPSTGAVGSDGLRFFATDVLQHPVGQEELRCVVAAAMEDITNAGAPHEGT